MMFLRIVLPILLPVYRLRAALLLRDAWLVWTGIAQATLKTARMVGVTRMAVALALAYFGIP
jgi:hypothetical protein